MQYINAWLHFNNGNDREIIKTWWFDAVNISLKALLYCSAQHLYKQITECTTAENNTQNTWVHNQCKCLYFQHLLFSQVDFVRNRHMQTVRENKSLAFSFIWIDTHVPNRSQHTHTHTHRFLLQRSDTIKREIMRAGSPCPERENQSPAHHKSESRGQPITSTTTFLISPSFKGFD